MDSQVKVGDYVIGQGYLSGDFYIGIVQTVKSKQKYIAVIVEYNKGLVNVQKITKDQHEAISRLFNLNESSPSYCLGTTWRV